MIRIGILSIIFIAYSSCAAGNNSSDAIKSQIRQYQTHVYGIDDSKILMKAIFNVFQNNGYIIKNADTELGFIHASKEVDVENAVESTLLPLLVGHTATWGKNKQIECTVNINDLGKGCRVRANCRWKIFDNKGNVTEVKQEESEKFYTKFFSKVNEEIIAYEPGLQASGQMLTEEEVTHILEEPTVKNAFNDCATKGLFSQSIELVLVIDEKGNAYLKNTSPPVDIIILECFQSVFKLITFRATGNKYELYYPMELSQNQF